MAVTDAAQKLEQARLLLEEAKSLTEEKTSADANELRTLKEKLASAERELQRKDRLLQSKKTELQRRDRELQQVSASLQSKTEALETSKRPVTQFIIKELQKSWDAVTQAKQVNAQSPSKYTAGFVELAKGSHDENVEMFTRLAEAVGLDLGKLESAAGLAVDEVAAKSKVETIPVEKKVVNTRKPLHASRYGDRSTKLVRRDSAVA